MCRLTQILFFLLAFNLTYSQYEWDIRDPVDLNVIDLADNKLLLYNALGLTLTALLHNQMKTTHEDWFTETHFDLISEYDRIPLSRVQELGVRLGYQMTTFLAWGTDIKLIRASDDDVRTFGLGGRLFFSWYILNYSKFRLYYDNGVGPNLFLNPFPTGGTHLNFSTVYGLNIAFQLKNKAWVIFGIKNMHISNAGIKGKERNPALDGWGMTFGISPY